MQDLNPNPIYIEYILAESISGLPIPFDIKKQPYNNTQINENCPAPSRTPIFNA